MPKGKPQQIDIGPAHFGTQKEALEYFGGMLRNLPPRVPLGEPHDSLLRDLLGRHPRSMEKIGCGVGYFTIDSDYSGGLCFHLHRKDGTRTDFSFHTCVKGESLAGLVTGAMRNAVADQIDDFRRAAYEVSELIPCQITGQLVAKVDCHIDHAPPKTFQVLVQEWLQIEGLTWKDVSISRGTDNQVVRRMQNVAQVQSWQTFHGDHARLRVTTILANLSDSKLEYSRRLLARNLTL